MATLDELVIRIRADASQLQTELNRTTALTQQSAGKMSSSFAAFSRVSVLALAAVGVGMVSFTKNAVAGADALNDLSARTGVAAEYLSAMRTEIENNGGTVEQFAQALFMMNRQLGEAIKGNDTARQAFDDLGLSIEDLVGNSPEENFRLIAEAISHLPTEFERAEASAALFGRGVAGLQPVIRQGAAGIDEIMEKSKGFGESLSKEQLQAIDDFGDGMNSLGNLLENLAAGAFANTVIGFQEVVAGIREAKESVELFLEGGTDAINYIEKARAGGFATTVSRGPVNDPAPTRSPRVGASASQQKAAATEANKVLREREAIIERNRTAYEVMIDDSTRAAELFADDQEQMNRELQRSWEEYVSTFETGTEEAKDSAGDLAVSIRSSLGNAFEDALFDAENFGDALGSILDGIARQIARATIIDPISKGITDAIGGGDLFGGLGDFFGGFFAEGGRPPVGKASIVGDGGEPEWFIPDTAGTIVPFSQMGSGTSVTVIQHNSFGSGVTRQEVAGMLPALAAASKQAVFDEIQRGGRGAQIVGKRN